MRRLRFYTAGLLAFLVGIPLTGKAFGEDLGSVGGATGSFIDTLINESAGYS